MSAPPVWLSMNHLLFRPQAVESIQASFMACGLVFAPEETSGIPGEAMGAPFIGKGG